MKIGNAKDQEAGIRPINVDVRVITGTTQCTQYMAIMSDIYDKMKTSTAFFRYVFIDREGIHAHFDNGMTADELGQLLDVFNTNRDEENCTMLTLSSSAEDLLIRIW